MKRVVPLVAVLAFGACKRAEAPVTTTPSQQPTAPAAAAEPSPTATTAAAAEPTAKSWKVKPTSLSVIKADPPSYVDKPTLVYVVIKPTDYFNYGYNNARNSHFAFEMRPALENEEIGDEKLYGYASRSWARPFFETLNKRLDKDNAEYADATLVITYVKRRYDGRSADHVEILAAKSGKELDMDPAAAAPVTAAVAAGGRGGDCKMFAELYRTLKKAGMAAPARTPQYCNTYPAGLANRVFAELKSKGADDKSAICTAAGVEHYLTYEKFKSNERALGLIFSKCAGLDAADNEGD